MKPGSLPRNTANPLVELPHLLHPLTLQINGLPNIKLKRRGNRLPLIFLASRRYLLASAGLTTLNNGRVNTGVGNRFAGIDDLTWVRGRHVVKAGVEIRRMQMNQESSSYGAISFNSLAAAIDFAEDTENGVAHGPDGNTNDQRPNVVSGQPLYLAGGKFNPSAFCTPGTADPAGGCSRGNAVITCGLGK